MGPCVCACAPGYSLLPKGVLLGSATHASQQQHQSVSPGWPKHHPHSFYNCCGWLHTCFHKGNTSKKYPASCVHFVSIVFTSHYFSLLVIWNPILSLNDLIMSEWVEGSLKPFWLFLSVQAVHQTAGGRLVEGSVPWASIRSRQLPKTC